MHALEPMDMPPRLAYWALVISVLGAALSWRVWVYFQSLTFVVQAEKGANRRRGQIAQGTLIFFSLAVILSLGGIFFVDPASTPSPPPPSTTPAVGREADLSAPLSPLEAQPRTPFSTESFSEKPQHTPTAAPTAIALVANTNGAGVNVRASPGLDGPIVTALAEGARVTLLGGEEQADGFTWQEVQMEDGRQGWIASNFLLPVGQ